jgi:hypothetical protein
MKSPHAGTVLPVVTVSGVITKNRVLQLFNQHALPRIASKMKRSGIIWALKFWQVL